MVLREGVRAEDVIFAHPAKQPTHIQYARAKGVRPVQLVLRHGLRNALIPIVTVVGLYFGTLIGNFAASGFATGGVTCAGAVGSPGGAIASESERASEETSEIMLRGR
jgi:ABC-type microcin C transport system permease subunit YejE